jgi:hypothetical protein
VARIAANHLRQLQQMQSSAAPDPREVEIAHIADIFKPPEHVEPAPVKTHVAAVSSQPATSSSVAASSAAAPKPSPRPSASTTPHMPQQAHPGMHESELGAAVAKLSEELVIKSVRCRFAPFLVSPCAQVRGKRRARQADAARSCRTGHFLHAAPFVYQPIWRLRGGLQHGMAVG